MSKKPRIYTRKEWGAKGRDGFGKRPLPTPEEFAHHTVTPIPEGGEKATFKADAKQMQVLDRIGTQRFGGSEYNYVIMPSGRIFEFTSVGRIGAHTKGHNTKAVATAFVGNFQNAVPTRKALASYLALRAWLKSSGKVKKTVKVRPHRAVVATACPGNSLNALIDEINLHTRTMKKGHKGADVLLMKKRLAKLGYGGMNLKSNVFGTGTEKAVNKLQAKLGWNVSGKIGVNTYAYLIR